MRHRWINHLWHFRPMPPRSSRHEIAMDSLLRRVRGVRLRDGQAGNVITTNLPSGDVIIGVDGRADGAADFSGPGQDDWYQPFKCRSTLLEYTFQPGTYNVPCHRLD